MITYSFLQQYWWLIISLLGGILVFLLFVQGGQSMLFSTTKNEDERKLLVNILGRKWEYTFTTLVTFGGAFFASFPLFYSTSFGGAYWVWVLILFAFIIQAVSYEFQSKPNNFLGKKTYQSFLFINGILGTFLLGAAVATFYTGSDFTINKVNITNALSPVISQWGSGWHGLEALLDVRNWLLGFAVLFLSRTNASLFFINRIKNENLEKKSYQTLVQNAVPFLVFFLAFVIWILLGEGFAVDADGVVSMEKYKYFTNLIQLPIVAVVFLLGVVGVLYGIAATIVNKKFKGGIWFSGIGTVLTVTALLLIAGYNGTAYYPSTADLQSSLTITNSSSSEFTLNAMSIVSLFIPLVIAYIFYAWRSLEKKKTDLEDIAADDHAY